MPLDFSNYGNTTSTGYIRYMASTSSWQMRGENLIFNQAVFDLERIQTGWCYIAEGTAPEWVLDKSIQERAPQPEGDGWKRGFKVNVYSKAMFGDDEPVKEWATNSKGATLGMQDLYAEYERTRDGDKLPVVAFNGATPLKIGKGNTTVPNFKIVKYVDRPSELGSPPSSPIAAATDVAVDEF